MLSLVLGFLIGVLLAEQAPKISAWNKSKWAPKPPTPPEEPKV